MSSPDTGGKDSARLPGPAPPKAEASIRTSHPSPQGAPPGHTTAIRGGAPAPPPPV